VDARGTEASLKADMNDKLQIRLKNSSAWQGGDRWKWSVWVEGKPETIEQIDRVEYLLHPTFPNPLRVITNPASNFRLDSKGWGEFMVHAKVITKRGHTIELNHWVRLSDSASTDEKDTEAVKPSVFLAYSKADYPLAAQLSRFLEARGLEVFTENQIKPGEPINLAIKSLIGRADAVLALIAEEPSSWVLNEISEAEKQQIPIVPMLLGKETVLPPSIANKQALHIENPQDSRQVEEAIDAELSKLNL
jgi:transcription initiation factor IIF auxiliary subunit